MELLIVTIIGFRDGKVAYEHLHRDQASLLFHGGLLNLPGLPVLGAVAS